MYASVWKVFVASRPTFRHWVTCLPPTRVWSLPVSELEPFAFDAELFGLSQRDASLIDPQQRLFLVLS